MESCARCKKGILIGGAYGEDKDGNKHCYACCAEKDKESMREDGKIVLYLSGNKVTNWPASLLFDIMTTRESVTNWGLTRHDVWFVFENRIWWGRQQGDNNQLCYCKRLKAHLPRYR